tara:strand:- start:409 stop:648 length:240 start_codon:yes stop_codon:yes gene_type:complete
MNKTQVKRLENDIAYCVDYLDLTNEQIGEMLRACERLGNITVEYFCEEFIFDDEPDAIDRLHDDTYLNIAEFNSLYWEQ